MNNEVSSTPIHLSLQEAVDYTSFVASQIPDKAASGGVGADDEDADNILICDDQLSQMFGKGDFCKLRVIGQFNKGFILCTLNQNQDLFILDQHACDEKFNFETFSRTTVLHTQDLINPIRV